MNPSPPEDGTDPAVDSADFRATVALIAKSGEKFQIGDFQIDENGRLRPRPDGAPISFGFSYRGLDFMANVDTGATPRVRLDAELGKLPYRAEIGERRKLTRKIVNATKDLPRGRINLSESHDMHLSAEMAALTPLTPTTVLSALTAILLDFKPYLDLLHDVMLAPQDPAPEPLAPEVPAP